MTAPTPYSSATIAPARAVKLALIAILLLFAADWVFTMQAFFRPGGLDFGFTTTNVVYVLVRDGLITTALLASGAIALGQRMLLVIASVVVGVHLLFVIGMAVVQLMFGERIEFLIETALLIGCLVMIAVAVVLGFVAAAKGIDALRWLGVGLVALVAAAWSLFATLSFVGTSMSPGALAFVALDVTIGVLLVLAAAFAGMRSAALRYVAAGICILLVVWIAIPIPDAIMFRPGAAFFLILRALLVAAAAVVAFLAARAISRTTPAA